MRKFISIPVILFVLFFFSCSPSDSLTRQERKEIKQDILLYGMTEVRNLIESGTFIFTAQTAQPTGGTAIRLSSSMYSLESKDHIVKAVLPYFGEGYASHYSNEAGIRFEGEPYDYELSENEKRGSVMVEFKIGGKQENFGVTMTIQSSGFGTVTVLSQSRRAISYYGYIKNMPEDHRF